MSCVPSSRPVPGLSRTGDARPGAAGRRRSPRAGRRAQRPRTLNSVVDIAGWRLADAVDYEFAEGTQIAPGSFLVAARDSAALSAKYPNISEIIVGDYSGQLGNRTDRIVLTDAQGNPADVVEYFENGSWPSAADAGGSSLELRNPHADNSSGLAWAASFESDDSPWQTITYEGVAGRRGGELEPADIGGGVKRVAS